MTRETMEFPCWKEYHHPSIHVLDAVIDVCACMYLLGAFVCM